MAIAKSDPKRNQSARLGSVTIVGADSAMSCAGATAASWNESADFANAVGAAARDV